MVTCRPEHVLLKYSYLTSCATRGKKEEIINITNITNNTPLTYIVAVLSIFKTQYKRS